MLLFTAGIYGLGLGRLGLKESVAFKALEVQTAAALSQLYQSEVSCGQGHHNNKVPNCLFKSVMIPTSFTYQTLHVRGGCDKKEDVGQWCDDCHAP